MSDDIDARISRLMDQLMTPDVSEKEIERINQKINLLKSQRVMQT